MTSSQFHELTIKDVAPETASACTVTFCVPDALQETFEFIPGQYLTLRATVDGEDIRRSYSICSPIDDRDLRVGIKRVDGGAFSNFARGLVPGDTLQVMPPQGRFTAPIGGKNCYLLCAAGSGITPCLSIASSVLTHEPDSTITLIFGNQTTAQAMFRDELQSLKDLYTDRFQLIHVLSRESGDVELFNTRLNGALVEQLAQKKVINTKLYDRAFLCGPKEMIKDVRTALEALGMDRDAVKFELFHSAGAPARQTATKSQETGTQVSIRLDGSERSFPIDAKTETVLAAAQRAGLDLPFSCAGGMCCTCRCKVTGGEAEMDVNYSLQDWEIEAGFTLACQARPTGDTLSLDFDAA